MLGRLTRTQISLIFPGSTGFKKQSRRDSVVLGPGNVIDPMSRHPRNQDIFPKLDLVGGHLGDGFLVCSEQLEARAFVGRERASSASKSLQGQLCCRCPPALSCCSYSKANPRPTHWRSTSWGVTPRSVMLKFVQSHVAAGTVAYKVYPPPCVGLYFRKRW